MNQSSCPSDEDLKAFGRGQLSGAAFQRTNDHIQTCSDCLRRLDTRRAANNCSDLEDPLMSMLATLTPPPISKDAGLSIAVAKAVDVPLDDSPLPLPMELGPYCLLAMLGRGAMGAVYDAVDRRTSQPRAVKVLSSRRTRFAPSIQRFQRESELVIKLKHNNIVRAYDAGNVSGHHYLAMERLHGCDLASLLRSAIRLDVDDACEIVRQLALGLDDIHQHGLVHRDVKPSNAMLVAGQDQDATVKVLDLGLALVSEFAGSEDGRLTATEELLGTVDYMAPEQGGTTVSIDARADIYSLGATLYQLLSGKVPFQSDRPISVLQRMRQMANHEPVRLENRLPGIDRSLSNYVHQMLERDRELRPRSAASVAQFLSQFCERPQLQRLLEEAGGTGQMTADAGHPVETGASRRSEPKNTRAVSRRAATACVGLASIALVGGTIGFAIQEQETTGSTLHKPRRLQPLAVLRGHENNVFGASFLPNSTRFVTVSWDGTLRCWDAAQQRQIWSSESRKREFLVSLAVANDGSKVAAGTPSQVVYVWDSNTGELLDELRADDVLAPLSTVAFSPDDRFLTAVSDSGVVLTFDLEQGRLASRLDRTGGRRRIAYVQEGTLLLAARTMGLSLSVIDPLTGPTSIQFVDPPEACHGLAMVDEHRFAVACPVGHLAGVSLWDVRNPEGPDSHYATEDPLEDIAYSPSGTLVVGSVWRKLHVGRASDGFRWLTSGTCKSQATQRIGVSSNGEWIVSAGGWRVNQRLDSDGDFGIRIWQLV
ncbi:MAG: serine/threonine-protein kinase [Planctomycetota bacterium]